MIEGSTAIGHVRFQSDELVYGCRMYADCEMRYALADPWAVSFEFRRAGEFTKWHFARLLLAEGLNKPAGMGDVRFCPDTNEAGARIARLTLSSPDGIGRLWALRAPMVEFVKESFILCPPGKEERHQDLDRLVQDILHKPGPEYIWRNTLQGWQREGGF